jgi:hypothetical protein
MTLGFGPIPAIVHIAPAAAVIPAGIYEKPATRITGALAHAV